MQKLYRLPCVLLKYAELEDTAINLITAHLHLRVTDTDLSRNLIKPFFFPKA